jgi:hypothetical protein
MEVSIVRQRVHETIERAKRRAAERRARTDAAGVAFGTLLERTAVPLFRQIVNVLRVDGYLFTVFTPSGSVRLTSDRRAEDFVELLLETSGDEPQLVLHTSRSWGGGVIESENVLGDPDAVTEDELLAAVLHELERLVER